MKVKAEISFISHFTQEEEKEFKTFSDERMKQGLEGAKKEMLKTLEGEWDGKDISIKLTLWDDGRKIQL